MNCTRCCLSKRIILSIDFTLETHRVVVDYTMGNLSQAALSTKHNLLSSSYHKTYSQEEIDALVHPILTEMVSRIEQWERQIAHLQKV